MLEKNVLSEYCDDDLNGDITYDRKDICKIVEDSMILNAIGKMKQVVM